MRSLNFFSVTALGWFRDNQQVYHEEAPQDHDEHVRSFHPAIAIMEAETLMTLLIGNARDERDRIMRGQGHVPDNSLDTKQALARDARKSLVEVMEFNPMVAED